MPPFTNVGVTCGRDLLAENNPYYKFIISLSENVIGERRFFLPCLPSRSGVLTPRLSGAFELLTQPIGPAQSIGLGMLLELALSASLIGPQKGYFREHLCSLACPNATTKAYVIFPSLTNELPILSNSPHLLSMYQQKDKPSFVLLRVKIATFLDTSLADQTTVHKAVACKPSLSFALWHAPLNPPSILRASPSP